MKVSIIAAIGKKRELGKSNKLLWDIPEDLQHFRTTTKGHPVIMGRKTFESIGRPLPARQNIVVTRDTAFKAEGCSVFHSLEKALAHAKTLGNDEVFVIGGGEIYKQALPFADKLYLTVIDATYDADTYFPDYAEFSKIISQKESSNQELTYRFYELERA